MIYLLMHYAIHFIIWKQKLECGDGVENLIMGMRWVLSWNGLFARFGIGGGIKMSCLDGVVSISMLVGFALTEVTIVQTAHSLVLCP